MKFCGEPQKRQFKTSRIMKAISPLKKFAARIALCLMTFFMFSGCYSFKGISIPPDVSTFYIKLFENQAADSEPTLPLEFTELLKDRIRRETRLSYNDESPDIEFSGTITSFRVTAEAPKAGEQIGYNQLTISMQVEFKNNKDEKANWKQQFSYYDFFEPDQNLLDVQTQLIKTISDELVDRIFNRAFTNW
jgi:lipopolysaccharide assembly LptE-like protein